MTPPFERAREVFTRVRERLCAEEVRAWAIGIGDVGGALGFNVHLSTARRPAAPCAGNGRRREIFGFPVGYVELQGVPTLAAHLKTPVEQSRMTPPLSGAEIENYTHTSHRTTVAVEGSLGCFVRDAESLQIGFVSCAHVLSPGGLAAAGESIVQPASRGSAHQIGDFERAIDLEPSPSQLSEPDPRIRYNSYDIAFAYLTRGCKPPANPQAYHHSHGGLSFGPSGTGVTGEKVFKVSRRGYTEGRIKDLSTTLPTVPPGGQNGQEYWFADVISIESTGTEDFAQAGDSGSLVVKPDGTVIGMLFATAGRMAYAFALDEAIDELRCIAL